MRDFSSEYSLNEESRSNSLSELYQIVSESATQYYCNSNEIITYMGNSYTPATIERKGISYNSELETTTLGLSVAIVESPFYEFLIDHFHEEIKINIYRYFSYNDGVAPLYSGILDDVTVSGSAASVTIAGIESFLLQTVPRFYYQPACNNTLFDTFCTLTDSDYDVNEAITAISTDGLTLSGSFSTTTNYLLYGQAVFGTERRMIVYHSSTIIKIRFPFSSLETDDVITVYPGCDKTLDQCVARFNNKVNFLGFPYIPKKNPATKVSR